MIEVSYSEARQRLAELLNRVSDDREVIRIRRQGGKRSAVLVDAEEWDSLQETLHLFATSPANARALWEAMAELDAGGGKRYTDLGELWRSVESDVGQTRRAS
jgi:antitoxin YefM